MGLQDPAFFVDGDCCSFGTGGAADTRSVSDCLFAKDSCLKQGGGRDEFSVSLLCFNRVRVSIVGLTEFQCDNEVKCFEL